MRNAYKILVRKLERMREIGRLIFRWENKVTIDFREIGWDGVDWLGMGTSCELL